MKQIFLLILISFNLIAFGQHKTSIVHKVEKWISDGDDFFKNIDTTFTSNELIGNVLAEEYGGMDSLYFVNDKYFLKIYRSGENVLGTYIFEIFDNVPFIILLSRRGELSSYYQGIVVKQDNQKYRVDWRRNTDYIYNNIGQADKNKTFLVNDEKVDELNFINPDISFDILNAKIGMKLNGEKFIDNVCDSLKIYGEIATIFNSGKISMYNLKGELLCENLKAFYQYSLTCHQVIDSMNNMFFIDNLGNKSDKPAHDRWMQGNDTDTKRIINYFAHKNKILKVSSESFSLDRYSNNSMEDAFDKVNKSMFYILEKYYFEKNNRLGKKDLEYLVEYNNFDKLLFLNKVLVGDEYVDQLVDFLLTDLNVLKCDIIELPEDYKIISFVNGSTVKMSAEDYWYFSGFFKPLKPSYIITKKTDDFGVWDLEEKRFIIPFDYQKICLKERTHYLLKKNDLFTYYPYIGLIPKYKGLSDYIDYYARFEYPDGKKGWVDRNGIEYFDPTEY